MFLRLLEFFSIAVIVVIAVTQIGIPAWKHQKLFPLFRKSQKTLEKELAEAEQKKSELNLHEDIEDIKREAELDAEYRKKRRQQWKS